MNLKYRAFLHCLRIFEVVMQALVFFVLLLMLSIAFTSTQETSVVTCLLVSVLPVLVLYLARRYIHKSAVIFVLHIGVASFIFLMGNSLEEKMAYILVGIILMIYSVSLCIKEPTVDSEKMPVVLICVFIGAVFMGNYSSSENLARVGIYCGEVFLVIQVIYHSFSNVNDYIIKNRELTALPVKQIITVNTFLMTILVTLCGGVILLVSNSYVNRMLQTIGILLKDGVAFIIRYLFSFGNPEEEKSLISETVDEKGINELQSLVKDSAWADIINGIGMVLGVILVIVAVIIITVGLSIKLVRLVKSMGSSEAGEDIKEFVLARERKEFRKRHHKMEDMEPASNAKLRKIYKSIVTKNAAKSGNKINNSMMPTDISKLYIRGDHNTVTEIYEKARYSNQQVTQQEIEDVKKYRKL